MFAVGCYWGEDEHLPIWQKSLGRLANSYQLVNGIVILLRLKLYPAFFRSPGGRGIQAVAEMVAEKVEGHYGKENENAGDQYPRIAR